MCLTVYAADIGEEQEEIEFVPFPAEVPAEPAPAPKVPEGVPA